MRGKNEVSESLIPVSKGKAQNVLGFRWHRCQRFSWFVFEGSTDSSLVIGCFESIAQEIEKETVIVLDNAPIHRSEEFEEKIQDWEKLSLKIYYLPAYCPSLNSHRTVMGEDKI